MSKQARRLEGRVDMRSTVRRADLKPKRPQTDRAFLATAEKAARRQQAQLDRDRRSATTPRDYH